MYRFSTNYFVKPRKGVNKNETYFILYMSRFEEGESHVSDPEDDSDDVQEEPEDDESEEVEYEEEDQPSNLTFGDLLLLPFRQIDLQLD